MWVDTGSKDLGRVYFPVRSQAEGKRRREELIEKALEFQSKGMFVQEVTSPEFLVELAEDFFSAVASTGVGCSSVRR